MKPKNKIVFVVDMINGFVKHGNLSDNTINQITPKIIELLQGNDAIFVCDAHHDSSLEFENYPKHCLKDSSESEVIEELQPFVKQKLFKNSTNAFHCLDVKILDNYDEIIICGCCSDICVLQFALSVKTYLHEKDQRKAVVVYEDAISTFNNSEHSAKVYQDFALKLMKNAGITIK